MVFSSFGPSVPLPRNLTFRRDALSAVMPWHTTVCEIAAGEANAANKTTGTAKLRVFLVFIVRPFGRQEIEAHRSIADK
jgi:hypothetical protein